MKTPKLGKQLTRFFLVCTWLLIFVSIASAYDADGSGSGTPWWKVVSGIIAIPVAILSGWLAWKQIGAFKKPKSGNGQKGPHIKVMNGTTVSGSKLRNISGIDASGSVAPQKAEGDISILNKGHVKDSEVGDITGIKR
jgi:hypothetical protein